MIDLNVSLITIGPPRLAGRFLEGGAPLKVATSNQDAPLLRETFAGRTA